MAGITCAICPNWPKRRGYCSRCLPMVEAQEKELSITYQNHVERLVRGQVNPTTTMIIEQVVPYVEIAWQPGEMLRAVKSRMEMAGVPRAVLYIPGAETFPDAMLKVISALTYYTVSRGTDTDTLLVEDIRDPVVLDGTEPPATEPKPWTSSPAKFGWERAQ